MIGIIFFIFEEKRHVFFIPARVPCKMADYSAEGENTSAAPAEGESKPKRSRWGAKTEDAPADSGTQKKSR